MKKIFALILAMGLLVGCGATATSTPEPEDEKTARPKARPTATVTPEPDTTPTPTPTATPTPVPIATPTPARLSGDQASAIAQGWLDEHPIEEHDVLERGYVMEQVSGQEYYRFFLDSPQMYWLSLLVHAQTGDMLYMIESDGEVSSKESGPLDAWYAQTYGDDT